MDDARRVVEGAPTAEGFIVAFHSSFPSQFRIIPIRRRRPFEITGEDMPIDVLDALAEVRPLSETRGGSPLHV